MTGYTARYQNSLTYWEEMLPVGERWKLQYPSHKDTWRLGGCPAEELELKGLQGAAEVRFSMLQAVVPPPSQSPWKTKSKVFYRISSWHTVSPYTPGRILVRKEESGHLFLHFLNKWWDVWILQEGRTFTKHPWTELLILVTSEQLVQSVAFAVKLCKPGAGQRQIKKE